MSSPLEQVMEHARRELTKTIVGQADALGIVAVGAEWKDFGHEQVRRPPGRFRKEEIVAARRRWSKRCAG